MYPCPLFSVALPIIPSVILVLTPPVIFTCVLDVMAIIVVVAVAGCGCSGCGHSCGCSLPFLVCLGDVASTEPYWYYVPIWHTILAHMAQWSSAYFILNAIATTTGHMFKSVKKQIFFALH